MQCRKLAKTVHKLAGTLENLQKSIRLKGLSSKENQEVCKMKVIQTQEMLEEAKEAHDKAVAKMYKLLRNFLSGNLQAHFDQICRKMHKRDSWAGVNGQMTTGRRPRLWTAFQDCLELHKLIVFTADMAKRQWYYIQQVVHGPQWATVRQLILHMGVLNDYVGYFPTLKDSPKAIPTKKENIPFSKADLAAIILAFVPII